MIDEKNKTEYEQMKQIIIMIKETVSEKTLVEYFLNLENEGKTVKSIGHVKNIDSKYKNDIFEEIYEDEEGFIIDLRLFAEKPTTYDKLKMTEYWIELENTFQKSVKPYIIIRGE